MSEPRPRHWTFAAVTALMVHLAVALAWLWEAEPSGARAAGVAGVEISMGPAGGAPGAEAASEAEPVEVEAVEPAQVRAEDVPAEPLQAADATPVEADPVEADPVDADAVDADPVETAPVEPTPVEREPMELEPVDVEESETAEPVDTAEATPMPKPTEAPPKPVQEPPEEEVAAKPESSAPGAGGKSGTTDAPDTGSSSDDASAGGTPGPSPDYLAKLQAWLERHKEYPRRAQIRRQEGTVILFFVMNAEGHVLEHRIQRSSGHDTLDREVIAMIERAQPLPRMPEHMRQSRLELAVPVQFYLR